MKLPRGLDLLISIVVLVLFVCPELAHARTWWWALMKGSQESARRCGQLALMAEHRYRAEVSH